MKTFSVNAISELLERDRATVVRALRGVPADGSEQGQPRWRMATAVAELARHNRADNDDIAGGNDPALVAAYTELDAAIEEMEAAPSLERRRSIALNIVRPLLAKTDSMLRAAGKAAGYDPELVHLRADHLGMVMLRGLQGPCRWSFDEALKAIGI